jgi:DnaJ like chaperone protein
MAITGKLLGALIGSVAGPLGTLLGGVIGHFFDKASEERQFLGPASAPRFAPGTEGWRTRPDPVSQAQINFLTCLIGLSISVADADGRVKSSHVEALKGFFRQNFTFPSVDQELIQRLVDEMYVNRDRIDVQGLCAYFAAVSTFEGRVLLLRLLFQIARSDNEGASRIEEDLIRRITLLLGLGEGIFRQVRAEYASVSGRAWEILGIDRDAGIDEVKSAYRQLTLQNHPDRVANLGPEFVRIAEEKFKAIQEAYEEIRREKGF